MRTHQLPPPPDPAAAPTTQPPAHPALPPPPPLPPSLPATQPLRPAPEGRKERQCLSHEGSGNTRQRQCLSHEGGGNTQGRGSVVTETIGAASSCMPCRYACGSSAACSGCASAQRTSRSAMTALCWPRVDQCDATEMGHATRVEDSALAHRTAGVSKNASPGYSRWTSSLTTSATAAASTASKGIGLRQNGSGSARKGSASHRPWSAVPTGCPRPARAGCLAAGQPRTSSGPASNLPSALRAPPWMVAAVLCHVEGPSGIGDEDRQVSQR